MHQTPAYARMAHIIAMLKSGRNASVQAILKSLASVKMDNGTTLKCVSKTVIRDIARAIGAAWRLTRTPGALRRSSTVFSAPSLRGSNTG